MGFSIFSTTCVLFLSLWTGSNSICSDTVRVRRPWHSLSEGDQLLYVNAFQSLRRESILVEFIEAHAKATSSDTYNIHSSSQNFFWHSYWLYLLEDAIRDLGGEYECFTIPYWDLTHDYHYLETTENAQIKDIPIYNSNLGGTGNEEDDYCVEDERWNRNQYTTDFLCADDEEPHECCLKRFTITAANSTLYSGSDFSEAIFLNDSLKNFSNFQSRIKEMHGNIHRFVGSISGVTHFNPGAGEAVCDPLFPLFHSFLEYVRLLREDCYQYDLIPNDQLDLYEPYAYEEIDTDLDYPMDFSCLCDQSDGEHMRFCSDHVVTARLMYDLSPNSMWGIVYELGSFWDENEELSIACSDYLNDTWWALTPADAEEESKTGDFDDGEAENNEFVSDAVPHTETRLTVVKIVVLLLVVAVMVVLKRCIPSVRMEEKLEIKQRGTVYGATQKV